MILVALTRGLRAVGTYGAQVLGPGGQRWTAVDGGGRWWTAASSSRQVCSGGIGGRGRRVGGSSVPTTGVPVARQDLVAKQVTREAEPPVYLCCSLNANQHIEE